MLKFYTIYTSENVFVCVRHRRSVTIVFGRPINILLLLLQYYYIWVNLCYIPILVSSSSSSGILPFLKNSRSMTPITWQAAVDDEEQRSLLQDILEAAVDDRRQTAVDVEEQQPQLQDIFEAAINGNHV